MQYLMSAMGVERIGTAEQCTLPVELSLLYLTNIYLICVSICLKHTAAMTVRMSADTDVNIAAWSFPSEHQLCSSRRRKYQV